MNRTEPILKIVYWSAITLAAILKARSARRLPRCLLHAFLCAHIERDVWVRGRRGGTRFTFEAIVCVDALHVDEEEAILQ